MPEWLKYPQPAHLFIKNILGCPITEGYLIYTQRDTNLLINHTYGACDQINQVLLDVLRFYGFETAILAVPEHTCALVKLEGQYYIVDADREITNIDIDNYEGLDAYLKSGLIEKLYSPIAKENKDVEKMFNKYRTSEYKIFEYNGTWQVVNSYNKFERYMQRAKYILSLSFILVGFILYISSCIIKLLYPERKLSL